MFLPSSVSEFPVVESSESLPNAVLPAGLPELISDQEGEGVGKLGAGDGGVWVTSSNDRW